MNKHVILYMLSIAIDKGSIFLFFPLMLKFLTLEEFGIWSMIIVVSNLLMPIITLNGSSAILREGSEKISVGKYLLQKFIIFTFFIGIVFSSIVYLIDNLQEKWVFYSFFIAMIEGLLVLVLTYLRVKNKSLSYLIINILKVILLFAIILYAINQKLSFSNYLFFQVSIIGILSFSCVFILFSKDTYKSEKIIIYPIMIFSISLILHGLAQWIMSSSDRLLIEYLLGTKSVGIYSLSYNIAQLLTLINMGLALVLPTYLIKNYKNWKEKNLDNVIIQYYTYTAIGLIILIYIMYYLDYRYLNILGYYSNEILNLITINYLAIYVLGLYTFYANYLFYHKKGKIISKTTFYAAIVNVIFSITLIYMWGLIGASIGTLVAYFFYLYYIRFKTMQIEVDLNIKLMKNIISLILVIIILRIGISNVIY